MSDDDARCRTHGIRRCTICNRVSFGFVPTTHVDPYLSPWQTNPTAGTSEDAAAQLDMARDLDRALKARHEDDEGEA